MRALIWKEFRLCWPILLVGAALLAFPYMLMLGSRTVHDESFFATQVCMEVAIINLYVAMFTLTLLGGVAIAGERNDHSVEFLAYLPVSRAKNLLSKLVWPVVAISVIVGVSAGVASVTMLQSNGHISELLTTPRVENIITASTLCCLGFSVAWMCSSFLRSPTFAVAGGLASPAVVSLVESEIVPRMSLGTSFAQGALTVASICFVAGCVHYLLRVEP